MVEQNNSKPNSTEAEDESAFTDFNLPLDNVDRFKELNNFLKNPQEFSKGVSKITFYVVMSYCNVWSKADRALWPPLTRGTLATSFA